MAEADETRLRRLLKKFRSGMLVTRNTRGEMRARPMTIAKMEDDGRLYFTTSIESGKVAEIVQSEQVAVSFQSRSVYVSLTGHARVVEDRRKIDEAWNETMRVWFPKGKDDPTLCLLEIDETYAEYWTLQGTRRVKYLVEAAKAYVKGRRPGAIPELHGEVHLHAGERH